MSFKNTKYETLTKLQNDRQKTSAPRTRGCVLFYGILSLLVWFFIKYFSRIYLKFFRKTKSDDCLIFWLLKSSELFRGAASSENLNAKNMFQTTRHNLSEKPCATIPAKNHTENSTNFIDHELNSSGHEIRNPGRIPTDSSVRKCAFLEGGRRIPRIPDLIKKNF